MVLLCAERGDLSCQANAGYGGAAASRKIATIRTAKRPSMRAAYQERRARAGVHTNVVSAAGTISAG